MESMILLDLSRLTCLMECHEGFEYRKDSCLAGADCGEQMGKGSRSQSASLSQLW